jgi:hypothetical protein
LSIQSNKKVYIVCNNAKQVFSEAQTSITKKVIMNKAITVFISGASFLISTQVAALSQGIVPTTVPIIPKATISEPAPILAKKEGGKKEKKLKKEKENKMLKSDHENKGKHKGHDNNEHSNAGDGKLKGLDRADEAAGEHGHRDKARRHDKHESD